MGLNSTQRKILKNILRNSVDFLIEQKQSHWLAKLIQPVKLSLPEVIKILSCHPNLIKGLSEAVNIPNDIRKHTRALGSYLNQTNPTIPSDVLQELKKYPNYNPYNIAAMQQFEDDIKALDEEVRRVLIYLRELYLEMTPLKTYNYDVHEFRFRIGEVPLNLNNYGERPLPNEISEEVADYIQERLELEQQKQQALTKLTEQFQELTAKNQAVPPPQASAATNVHSIFNNLLTRVPSVPTQNAASLVPSPLQPLLQKAQTGDAKAQCELGLAYLNGSNTPKDYAQAFNWLKKAAEQGFATAQHNLGYCYENGQGVPQDYTEAVKWYRKAAEQGFAAAQHNLGYCYENGQGMPQDYTEAVKWYRKAAAQGFATAQTNLGYCYENGQGVPQDYTEAVKWFKKAAAQGNTRAQTNLGFCYYSGRGTPQDYTEAVKWYRKAAERGDAAAQNNLGACYYDGQGVPQDYTEAVKWYRKAAAQGNTPAQTNLGFCYYSGRGMPQDYTEAVKWYRKAAERGDAAAQNNLGACYYDGQGVPQDYTEAVKWYRKAAAQGHEIAQINLRVFEINHSYNNSPATNHNNQRGSAEEDNNSNCLVM